LILVLTHRTTPDYPFSGVTAGIAFLGLATPIPPLKALMISGEPTHCRQF
jgi:hypothetical protein